MEKVRRGRGDLLGVLAASWIGGLGGLFVGALGQGETLILPAGYYANGIVYGFVGGAFLGSLVGLAAGAMLVGRLGDRLGALVGGALGLVGAAVYGRFAYGLALYLESAFLDNAAVGALLAAIAFAAAGGVFAAAVRSKSGEIGRRAALQDLIAGGILGSFLGLLGGGFTELATFAWVFRFSGSVTPGMNEGLFFGFYLGAGVGATVAALVGTSVRRLRAIRKR